MPDLHTASAGKGFLTHLTADAETTLCDRKVVDLPNRASVYCTICIDKEAEMQKDDKVKHND